MYYYCMYMYGHHKQSRINGIHPESTECGRCYAFGCMVAIRGRYRMARGWHYAKLSLSSARRLSFFGMCILLFLFLSLCRFCLFAFFFCSHWSLVDVPLISFCPADHVPDWQPRTRLATTYSTGYTVEARSVNVKKTTTIFSLNTSVAPDQRFS